MFNHELWFTPEYHLKIFDWSTESGGCTPYQDRTYEIRYFKIIFKKKTYFHKMKLCHVSKDLYYQLQVHQKLMI